jgi:hypothetical protein
MAEVIDPGFQIVAIQKGLAEEVAAHINPSVHLEDAWLYQIPSYASW